MSGENPLDATMQGAVRKAAVFLAAYHVALSTVDTPDEDVSTDVCMQSLVFLKEGIDRVLDLVTRSPSSLASRPESS